MIPVRVTHAKVTQGDHSLGKDTIRKLKDTGGPRLELSVGEMAALFKATLASSLGQLHMSTGSRKL